ncbi:unnamed protein product [Prunus armeniaca]|uniref:Uncharacterized protein n=1 Tax=Prunus armeniaca TaxID=36596 RepID=A0A6J5VVE7_PRUAR|nr:unnamed protein product [Prunus armeniaca]
MGNHIDLTITRDIEMEAAIEFRKALLTLVMVIIVVMVMCPTCVVAKSRNEIYRLFK